MTTNDTILLRQLLSQKQAEIAPDMPASDFFLIFAAEQALKDRDLSYDELQDGIVDGSGDGGIDAVYFFVDNMLYREEVDPSTVKRNVSLELVFVQAKATSGFSEVVLDRFISSTNDLLNLNNALTTLKTVYKPDLRSKIREFRDTYMALTSKFPRLTVRYYYATLGPDVHPNVQRKTEPLRDAIGSLFNPVEFSCSFLRAQELLQLARRSPITAHHLRLAENPISTGGEGFVCLVGISDYFGFVRAEDGSLKEDIFEGNVRDYQGNTEVNQQIRDTLVSPPGEDFWWMNNGITIICTSATLSGGKTLTIENAEIVNGLQTSREIFDACTRRPDDKDPRSVLVRVLVPQEEASRDRIIKATNSQTPIPISSLRATDKIHRDIEEFLSARGVFYDRRKNYYKNQGKPVASIVGIPYLAQSVLACALGDPASARARPSSLLKNDDTYGRIFSESYPLDMYFKCVSLARRVESVLRSEACTIAKSHWNNLRFYAAMLLALRLTCRQTPSIIHVAQIDLAQALDSMIIEGINDVYAHYMALGGTDQVAKGTELAKRVLEAHRVSTTAPTSMPARTAATSPESEER